mmetsp:Transcript_91026/g.253429  ORF Transcript_91026/g.253429 Transcript_91026/m.253429 type:complete len:494 (+) Transcript_91026:42-1523(+)
MGRLYVYHERQLGNLCGVHCINNLLQGPRFGPGDLAEIGARLDRKEQKLLGGLISRGPLTHSENFDGAADGGNFSVQVLRVALARAGLKLLPAEHPDGRECMSDPARAGAFIVQCHNHWFALRETGPSWWDLDSLLERPKPLDEPQLLSRLEKLRRGSDGNLFLVLGGRLPEPRPSGGDNWHDACALLAAAASERSASSSAPAPALPERDEAGLLAEAEAGAGGLEAFCDAERRAGLALVGGEPALAADILWRARRAVEKVPERRPRRLAKAISSAVDAVLQAKRGLPDAVAKLVALLCVPKPGVLAAAAARLDCDDLAHRLLTACARKAHGWLWTEGLAEAATIAVDLLLALPSKQASLSASLSASEESSVETASVFSTSGSRRNFSSRAAASPQLMMVAAAAAVAAAKDPNVTAAGRRKHRDETFEALDRLLGAAEVEGRLLGRPLVSEPGLKVAPLAGAGGAAASPRCRRPRSSRRPGAARTAPRPGRGG